MKNLESYILGINIIYATMVSGIGSSDARVCQDVFFLVPFRDVFCYHIRVDTF